MLHVRPSSRTNFDAYEKALTTLGEYKDQLPDYPGNAHFFAADWNIAQEFLKQNFTLSFTGGVTFAQTPKHAVIKNTPLNKILLETDAPYVSPIPYRGQRAEPIHVLEIAKVIAQIKTVSVEEVLKVTTQTVKEKFNIQGT
jgi:TatD DNase family protein